MPHAVAKREGKIGYLIFIPYRDTEHNTDKTVPVQIIGSIMRRMVEQFGDIPYEALWCIISLLTINTKVSDLIRQTYYTNTDKTVPVQIIGSIMRRMVEQFRDILELLSE